MEQYTEVKPLFYNKQKLIKQPEVIYRTNLGQKRYYYSIDKSGRLRRSPSVTTIIANEMKQSEWLIKWIANLGYEQAIIKRDRAGHYGTLFGICAAQFFIDGGFDFNTLKPRIDTFKADNDIDYPTPFWNFKLREDLYALNEFVCDYELEPLAIELMLFSKKGFAGALDIVVEMTVGTGQNGRILKNDRKYDKKTKELKEDKTRRVVALIDWKSGRHGFYPSNEAQLHFYKHLWEENFPHLLLDAVFNWSPKEWSDGSSSLYHLKEQSNSPERQRIWNYLENFQLSDKSVEKTFKRVEGKLVMGERSNNLKMETFQERINRIHGLRTKEPARKSNGDKKSQDTAAVTETNTDKSKQTDLLAEVESLISKQNGDKK